MATSHTPPTPARGFPYVTVFGSLMVSFGFTFVVMAAAYVGDIAALASAPADLWAAICGIPVENPLTFPLLLLTGALVMLGGMAVLLVDWWRAGRQR